MEIPLNLPYGQRLSLRHLPSLSTRTADKEALLMEINIATTDAEIASCRQLMLELRPQLNDQDFVAVVRQLMETQAYQLVYLTEGEVVAIMGMRIGAWLHTGTYLEIEELLTSPHRRSQGYGKHMMEWAKQYARRQGCSQLRLVSGVAREDAHRFYASCGMVWEAKYFSLTLS